MSFPKILFKSRGGGAVFSRLIYGKLWYDIFSGDLSLYTNPGSVWSIISGVAIDATVNWGHQLYTTSAMAQANYIVECDIKPRLAYPQFMARLTASNNFYFIAMAEGSPGYFRLYKRLAGSDTQIGSSGAPTILDNTWYTIRFDLQGTALKGYFSNVLQASATDSSITAAGSIGPLGGGAGTSYSIDNLKCFTSNIITMVGLATGAKFRIRKSDTTVIATSAAAANGVATINTTALADRPPYYDLQIAVDGTNFTITDTTFLNDIWGGDTYRYCG